MKESVRCVLTRVFLLGSILCVSNSGAVAADAPNFAGKTFVLMVASSPGGGTDTTARLVARYWGKYLPGNPEVIIRNRPLQTAAANYFQRKTRPDGLTVGAFAGGGSLAPVARNEKSVRYDPLSWEYIGSIERGPSVQFIRKSALQRLKDPQAKPVAVGSAGPGYRPSDAMAVYGGAYGGWNIKIVVGYPSSRDVYLAYERGEIDMFGSGTSRIIKRFLKGDAVALAVHEKRADYPEVPTLEQLLGDKLPEGKARKAYRIWSGPSSVDKYYVVPAKTPKAVVAVLRESFRKALADPDFVKAAQKVLGKGYREISGPETKQMVKDSIVIPGEVITFNRKLREKYGLPVQN